MPKYVMLVKVVRSAIFAFSGPSGRIPNGGYIASGACDAPKGTPGLSATALVPASAPRRGGEVIRIPNGPDPSHELPPVRRHSGRHSERPAAIIRASVFTQGAVWGTTSYDQSGAPGRALPHCAIPELCALAGSELRRGGSRNTLILPFCEMLARLGACYGEYQDGLGTT